MIVGAGPYMLALLYYLDRYAHLALTRFRPALDVNDEQEALLRYRLTTLPARPTLIATFVGFGIGALGFLVPNEQNAQTYHFANTPISSALYMSLYVLLWMIAGVCYYHLFHQLSEISAIYTRHTRINLFHQRPLYAFAWLTAYTAIGFSVPSYGSVILSPPDTGAGAFIQFTSQLPVVLAPIACFFWPLLGVHHLLDREKERLIDEN